jgi:hypothetical protein
MKSRILISVLAVALAFAGMRAQTSPPIYGQVISQSRGPVAGVTVSLLHGSFGRSTPVFTQAKALTFSLASRRDNITSKPIGGTRCSIAAS